LEQPVPQAEILHLALDPARRGQQFGCLLAQEGHGLLEPLPPLLERPLQVGVAGQFQS
jgi:hypothetical protein